jgi:hypothetical protein
LAVPTPSVLPAVPLPAGCAPPVLLLLPLLLFEPLCAGALELFPLVFALLAPLLLLRPLLAFEFPPLVLRLPLAAVWPPITVWPDARCGSPMSPVAADTTAIIIERRMFTEHSCG